jgi:hypothetical protein
MRCMGRATSRCMCVRVCVHLGWVRLRERVGERATDRLGDGTPEVGEPVVVVEVQQAEARLACAARQVALV